MEDTSHCFHSFKVVILLGRASKNAKAKRITLEIKLIKKRKVDEKVPAEAWTPSKKRHEANAWMDYISLKIDVCKEFDANFNLPKIHFVRGSPLSRVYVTWDNQ
jgi:hypothetical protein